VPGRPHSSGRLRAAEAARQRVALAQAAARDAGQAEIGEMSEMSAALPGRHRVSVAALRDYADRIDVRSPAEFALDRIPRAANHPVPDDPQRARIGTLYAASPFTARKLGAALVARNIAAMLETAFIERPREWRPLVYCWRGGQRSRALTEVLNEVGWR